MFKLLINCSMLPKMPLLISLTVNFLQNQSINKYAFGHPH